MTPIADPKSIGGLPASEFELDARRVRALLADQHDDLADLPIALVDEGWDNYIFRLGNDLAVRLPRRASAGMRMKREQKWLPQLASCSPLPIPAPIRVGKPALNYPWSWSVVPWIDGTTVNKSSLNDDQTEVMAAFLAAIHIPAPEDAVFSDSRGIPLSMSVFPALIEDRMARTKATTNFITTTIERLWHDGLEAPNDMPTLWLHGDLHGGNVLCRDGNVVAVIDWSDIAAGDIAVDLSCVWHLFESKVARATLMEAYTRPTEATWVRAKGWAVSYAVLFYDAGRVNSPVHRIMAERLFARLEADG